MNDLSTPASDAATAARQQPRNRQHTQAGVVFVAATVAILFIIPQYLASPYAGMTMSFGSAALLTVLLYLQSESFRSRRGSLVPAICLVIALWLLAAVSTALSLIG